MFLFITIVTESSTLPLHLKTKYHKFCYEQKSFKYFFKDKTCLLWLSVNLTKICQKGLAKIRLDERGDVRVGEWVMAYGSPLALKSSITVGIVSNSSRVSQDIGIVKNQDVSTYLQTDAIINVRF